MTVQAETQAGAPLQTFRLLRRTWLVGTIVLSLGAFAAAIALAPPTGAGASAGTGADAAGAGAGAGRALGALLFLGSSVHVAATAWFYTLPEIRAHALTHRGRYIVAPTALIVGTAVTAVFVPYDRLQWALLAYFAWQFFHFQKQNLGMAALAGVSQGSGSLARLERQAIVISGVGGIAGLICHPDLLQLGVDPHLRAFFPFTLAVFAAGVALGLYALVRRQRRPAGFMVVYLTSLLFFTPVFVFTSPYAAVAGLTVAHGYQYLLIVGLVSGAPRPGRTPAIGLAVMAAIAIAGGVALNYASHLHGASSALERALYGAYLGAVMAHFVIDAGLWRMRDEFPRRFLNASVPYLLRP
ncbi:hypothetical protein J4573_30975 [Actinomadura barringtoniae]|uniref:Uncharacterized protein n=1 Tax=Actinomadura barringtoniae TaxID=1427535 RepID=A0A939T3R5_9ACTN|nr:hypothetical protein [Actinomadura barringtoniae]MBO2451551.1 hypothetical protein [Actinomadura barringtoniae]